MTRPSVPPLSTLPALPALPALQPVTMAQAGQNGGPPLSAPLWQLLDQAAVAVQAVRGGASLNDALARVPPAQRPGVQALSFHGLRWLGSATEVRSLLAPKQPAPPVDALLLLALALLWPGEAAPYAEHTLVDQAVTAVRHRAAPAAGFVNAVLRRFLRERDALVAAAARTPLGAYNHPAWWVERVKRDWPQVWQRLLHSANERPPMTLRVNARRGTGAAYAHKLATAGHPARSLPDASLAQALNLLQPCAVQQLPGFADGEVSVQDASAQRAALLLLSASSGAGLPAGARVLDACAAPGGKTGQLLELADLDLLALDSDALRLQRVHETLLRLGLPAAGGQSRIELLAADARQPRAWWDGRPFDAILLDAPCTASGIVRRHPDIRWLRRPDDIAALAKVQAALLDALWPLLAPGGRLVYATCSLFKAEGQDQIDAFLQRLPPDAARVDPASPGHLLPLADNAVQGTAGPSAAAPAPDGFYLALLLKT
jgi:16S rRNA (cytosine967-C5)-methyltransferase